MNGNLDERFDYSSSHRRLYSRPFVKLLRFTIRDQRSNYAKVERSAPIGANEIDLNLFYTLAREELDAKLILTMEDDNFVKTERMELGEDFISGKIN